MDSILVIFATGGISIGVFLLIQMLGCPPIRTIDPLLLGEDVKRYYKTESYFRSGEAPPSFFGEDVVKIMEEKGAKIIVEDMICIGKRENNSFVSSPLLLSYFSQKEEKGKRKIEIKTIKSGSYLKDEDKTVYHPDHFHYRIFEGAIFFHGEDNITYYQPGSWYLKKKFKKKFDEEWKRARPLDEAFSEMEKNKKLLVETDIDRLYEKAKYEKATEEEIKKFKEDLEKKKKANIKI